MWFILTAQWAAAAGLELASLIIPSNYPFQKATIYFKKRLPISTRCYKKRR